MPISCGRFTNDGEEFLITRPDRLPREWYNCLWNDRFLCQVRPDGGGVSFCRQAGGARTLLNGGQRRIFVQNAATGEYVSFPRGNADEEVTIGQGYTTFARQWGEIGLRMQIVVPPDLAGERWTVEVANPTDKALELKVFSFMDVSLAGYFTPFQITCLKSDFDDATGILDFRVTDPYCDLPYASAFVASDRPVRGFDGVRGVFVGWDVPLEAPRALAEGGCTNTHYAGYGPAGVLETSLSVPPGGVERVRFAYALYADDEQRRRGLRTVFAGAEDEGFQAGLPEAARSANAPFQIDTPDPEIDRLFNSWAKHNLRFCVDWTRIYSRGFRDTLQDAMGIANLDPTAARELILAAMGHVYRSGRCVRAWDALSTTLSEEFYSDGPVWVPLAVNAFIRETGETSLLAETVPYLDGGSGTVLEHMTAAARFCFEDRGRHGLCRIHDGDWCDTAHTLGRRGEGVSTWLTIALFHAVNEIADLARFVGDDALAGEMADKAEVLASAVNQGGWDGGWYRMAYNDDGRPIGSTDGREPRVFLNPQSWAVLSGIAPGDRVEACLRVIDERLDSGIGPLVLAPAYTEMDPTIGTLTGFAPGTIENGSCYCHAAAFKVVADCVAGRGERALASLKAIMPGGTADQTYPDADCPPFAFTNSRAALFHPYLAARSLGLWATGTVSWCWTALSEWILGVRKTFEGLVVDPCIPADWAGFSVTRRYRGCEYRISVDNAAGVQRGVSAVAIDGRPHDGGPLPVEPGRTLEVSVTMG